jgi:hypothetical protein
MTITVPPAVREGLFIAAGQRCRSVSGLCSMILSDWLRANQPLAELTRLRAEVKHPAGD